MDSAYASMGIDSDDDEKLAAAAFFTALFDKDGISFENFPVPSGVSSAED